MVDVVDKFIEKKKAESKFIALADGESVVIKEVKAFKTLTKANVAGEEVEVLRLVCEVETPEGMREKVFDNGSQRFAKELKEKAINIGSGFKLTREGEQFDTRYVITDVKNL